MNDQTFDKPLNQWIEEDIPVTKVAFEPDGKGGGRMTNVTKMEKQKTMYINAPKQKIKCETGKHNFYVKDKHKWIFSCTLCSYSRMVYPVTYKFADGQLIHRETGLAI